MEARRKRQGAVQSSSDLPMSLALRAGKTVNQQGNLQFFDFPGAPNPLKWEFQKTQGAQDLSTC